MNTLADVAPEFVAVAHRIVWASVATVDPEGRPRSRILHPYWQWDGASITGLIATGPTPAKRAHLAHSPYMSVSNWTPEHDTCTAECRAEWVLGPGEREAAWETFKHAPAPVGYDPAIVPSWKGGPHSPAFAVLLLRPWRLRVFPGTVLMGKGATS